MACDSTSFVKHLLAEVPALRDVYDAHLNDNDELLPHVFMADVTRFVVSKAKSEGADETLAAILRTIEVELAAHHAQTENLIGVSFVENFAGEDRAIAVVLPLVGENLRREFRAMLGI